MTARPIAPRGNQCVASLNVGRETVSEWQPIDDDAKEAGEILVAHLFEDGSAEMAVASWWVAGWAASVCIPGDSMPSRLLPISFEPTHYAPLPAPPSLGVKG
jgi:hypothetical protein